jgi:hypothetical protein
MVGYQADSIGSDTASIQGYGGFLRGDRFHHRHDSPGRQDELARAEVCKRIIAPLEFTRRICDS